MFKRLIPLFFLFPASLACTLWDAPFPKSDLIRADIGPEATVHVSALGQDDASGRKEDPLLSIEAALKRVHVQQIILAPGVYPPIDMTLRRPVRIRGLNTDGISKIHANFHIRGSQVALQALEIHGALILENVRRAHLNHLNVHCQALDCIQVLSSHTEASLLKIYGKENTSRSLLVDASTFTANRLQVSGGTVAQILARNRSSLQLEDIKLLDAKHISIMVIGDSELSVTDGIVRRAKEFSLLINRSKARLNRVTLGQTQNMTIGIQGGRLLLEKSEIRGSLKGTINALAYRDIQSHLVVQNSHVHHGEANGLAIAGAHVDVEGSTFHGNPSAKPEPGEDAITLWGPLSSIKLVNVRIQNAAGFGVSFYKGAFGTVSATITGPRLDGIFSQSVSAEPIHIRSTHIENCREGSGITSFFGNTMLVEDVSIRSCARGGIVAGQGSQIEVRNARLQDNGSFGLGAFGGSHIVDRGVDIRNSPQLRFASCAEESQISVYRMQRDNPSPITVQVRPFCP